MTDPIYAIGDIHGYLDQLEIALDRIERDGGADAEVVVLGDLVDRGPDSRGVIEKLNNGLAEGRNWHVLKGNHDQMFRQFMEDGRTNSPRITSGRTWLNQRLGGVHTLASYGVHDADAEPLRYVHEAARMAVPPSHLEFLDAQKLYLERGPYLFVHAGIYPGRPLRDQDADDLLWIRTTFHDHTEPHPWLIVHGHTALDHPRHFGNRIDLDGGAGYGRPLLPAVFENGECWLLTETGRVALTPDS